MNHMSLHDFETRYRSDPDPWRYQSSGYERAKYEATVRACGRGPHHRALELGSSIGVLSAMLVAHCHQLVTIDGAPTAVAEARRRLAGAGNVQIVLGAIPEAIGPGPYDLVVASEILYYLDPDALARTFETLELTMSRGARLVAVHWRPPGRERPFTAAAVHGRLHRTDWLTGVSAAHTRDYLLDVMVRP